MDRRRLSRPLGLLAGLVWLAANPPTACGWGSEAHEAICEIAYRELTPSTAAKVDALVAGDPAIGTFRLGCVWPDFGGSEQDGRRAEHYVNLPRTADSIREARCPQSQVCLFTAIDRDSAVLASARSSAQEKLHALRFLGHWVGDIHQPLHVSYGDDRGGNDVLVRNDLGCRRNLHDVWDNCMPEDLIRKRAAGGGATGLASALRAEITPRERAAWLAHGAPLDWANESFAIARQPAVRYCVQVSEACRYSKTRVRFDGHGRRRSESLSQDYEDEEETIVRERLEQAGVRLAALLEKLLGKS